MAKDRGFRQGTRIDYFAALGQRIGHVPLGDRKLRMHRVGDVGIETYWDLFGNVGALHFQAVARLRPDNNASQPRRPRGHERIKAAHLVRVETLRGNPNAGVGMRSMQYLRNLCEKRKKDRGIRVAGIAAGDVKLIDLRQLVEDIAPSAKLRLDGSRIGIVLCHCWVEDRTTQAIFLDDP